MNFIDPTGHWGEEWDHNTLQFFRRMTDHGFWGRQMTVKDAQNLTVDLDAVIRENDKEANNLGNWLAGGAGLVVTVLGITLCASTAGLVCPVGAAIIGTGTGVATDSVAGEVLEDGDEVSEVKGFISKFLNDSTDSDEVVHMGFTNTEEDGKPITYFWIQSGDRRDFMEVNFNTLSLEF